MQAFSLTAVFTTAVLCEMLLPTLRAEATFTKDVAPIILKQCAPCHRPGESAPFSLLTFDDVAKRADQIVDVTKSRYMPPWLPDPTAIRYQDERILASEEIQTIQAWVTGGLRRGPKAAMPKPNFKTGWQLGTPDLIVKMDRAFKMPASGPDVYRNFVIPVPISSPKWVKAVELRPGNPRIVHHAFTLTDSTRRTRQIATEDAEPGFAGMDFRGASSPTGHFVGWQPGRRPYVAPQGMSWLLTPGTDLVIQMHMQCSGKTESIQPSVGLFFSDSPPTKHPFKLVLNSTDIDIPAGEANYTFTEQYTLTVDVQALAITAHAHYLGKRMLAYADLPDGTRQWLLRINDWDLNWQGDYRFREPISLPKGTTITQTFYYDNSVENIRNPNQTPKRVQFGPEATDEMGSVWIQLLPKNAQDLALLQRDIGIRTIKKSARRYQKQIAQDPTNARAFLGLGKLASATHYLELAEKNLRRAVELDPTLSDAHYLLGNLYLRSNKPDQALHELRLAIKQNPFDYKAYNDIGLIAMRKKNWIEAEQAILKSLEIHPYGVMTNMNLGIAYTQQRKFDAAIERFKTALIVEPDNQRLKGFLEKVQEARDKAAHSSRSP